jgi:hypothetical protein
MEKRFGLMEKAEFLNYKDNIHLVTMTTRPGSFAFITAIEWFWFSPRKDLNHLFNLTVVRWEGLDWLVVSIPKDKLPDVKKLAEQLGMRVADGVPSIIRHTEPDEKPDRTYDGAGVFIFPGGAVNGKDNKDMFTIENNHGSPIYTNCKKTHQDIRSAENEVNDGFVNGVAWTPEKIVEYVYGVPNFVANPNLT